MTDFEFILLKKLTHNGEFFGKVMPILKGKYFTDIGNQELFKLVKEYYNEYRSIPSLTELVAAVKNVSNAEIRAEVVKSLQRINTTEEVQNVEFLCDETVSWVKDAMYMEALQIGSDGLMNKDDNLKLKAQQIMDERAKVSIDTDLGLDFDDIDAMIEYYSERMTGIRTQHKELNKRLGPGFLPGTLSVILAASGVGKSLLMTDLISGMIKKNKNILLISLEMSDKEIMKRVHANAMDLPINSLLDLNKTQGELDKLDRPIVTKEMVLSAYNKMKTDGSTGKFFVKDYPSGSFSPLMLEQLVESYKIERGVEFDAIFVDYIGIMKSDLLSPAAGLYSYIKSIAEEVRATAKKLNVPIISASQLNRSATNNIDEADNSNVSDSMGTVMTADFMLFLLQNEEMKEKKEIVCKITKNRFAGRTDTWMMNIDYEHMRFNDMLIQNAGTDITGIDFTDTTALKATDNSIDDFGIITPTKQKQAEEFATNEVKDIVREDVQKVMEADQQSKDPMNNDINDIFAQLGI
jgi:replicative DNA helicase